MRTLATLVFLLGSVSLAAADAPKFEVKSGQLVLPSAITYDTAKASLKATSGPALEHIAAFLTERTDVTTLRIEVHSDNKGKEADNQKLTEARALVVGKDLVKRGIKCDRLVVVGFGSTKPVQANDTEEGRTANRRTDVFVAGLRGHAIGSAPLDGGGVVAGDLCK